MKEVYMIDNLEQLKSISDPLRVKIIHLIGIKPLTSQMLSDELEIPRSKIHYHLKELEKNGLIEVVRTEQVRNFIQMFYQPIAQSIIASPDLLLKQSESNDNFIKAFNVQFSEDLAEEFYESLKQLCDKFEEKSSQKSAKIKMHITLTKVD
ncbi:MULTISPECIES: ArsR/SmtB family transcription factor [Bacillus cereus group]|uniref:ArsR/SmtB family transcription factor n=1 Tax=Bacillus cereus group TaxID=86661 RepID=UPI0007FB3896|nr:MULTISPECIES: helix-turn-helix domain-containing protein [Bacillus cereus group]HDR7659088.1 helix-turn-helix transcriptional regulator [Bacillus wiedmannii]MCP1399593.1 DNA-binding transcriptional ArsR family regulator [Bacillus cereus]NKX12463.1 helix-turn-helix transcriptional regulator [Bacillus cereus]OBW85280.1 ArsR family transcriptional regulator [Bacillus cereus]PDX92525.1 ArsR family transcriptional regulator [Bacillus thuringiensis]